ncbi:ABC transporter substrate-binding protein [Ottowia thiooxydans]|uniref:Branched-chain amino acid transport system substrate-binding protein n=1 Tax=Ottowia thiooxydans TaxID=219182 RepID=A0ABV2QC48_9BURK
MGNGKIQRLVRRAVALTAVSAITCSAWAQPTEKIKVGLMLPASGTFAALGAAIENGFRMYVSEQGGKLGGREIEYFKVDDESDPSKAIHNVNRLIKRDNVDVLVGTVHSGVVMAMARAAKESGTILIVPNAGADAVTGVMCGPTIFRSSFSNWQISYPMGVIAAKQEGKKNAMTINWKYAAGEEASSAFKEGFEKNGGKVTRQLTVPFPNVEFQAFLTEIAAAKPDAVFAFFAGSGAVKFVKDYHASGLSKTIPLYGQGALTDGTLEAQGSSAEGILTTLHYADELGTERDKVFRTNYAKAYKLTPDVYSVQGYDAAQMLAVGLKAAGGDISKKDLFRAAIEKATIASPRGDFTISKSHNPVQDIYLRKVEGKQNTKVSIAAKKLADPARGCKL